MNAADYRELKNCLALFPTVSPQWLGLMMNWMNRADHFIETMTLEQEESTFSYLTERICTLLRNIPQEQYGSMTDADLCCLLAASCEILFLHASIGREQWDSTRESFSDFCRRHQTAYPHQLILDIPHTTPAEASQWLQSFLN